jgi:colicin import membrane protein
LNALPEYNGVMAGCILRGAGSMPRHILSSPLDLNEPVDLLDPFPYGWRYIPKAGRNGSETMVRVPLTLEDILHPREEDFRLLSDPHTEDCFYLRGAFRMALAGTPAAVVLTDCRVAWDSKGEYGHGPDVAVIFNVRKKKRWSTFNVVKEKTKPSLIIEVTSPSTRSTDLVDKVREYAEQGVAHYVIADAREKEDERQVSLIDYHLSPDGGYYSLPADDQGRVWLPEVKRWLGVDEGNLVCWDEKGEQSKTIAEEHQARLEAEKKASVLEARIKELQRRMRSGPKVRNGA